MRVTDDADAPSDPSGRQEGPRGPGSGDDAPSAGKAAGPDLVGEVVAGRYRVLSRLGEGAMGAVYLAEHLRMGRRDALKVLSRSLADDDDARARFTREARNASFINHPNACTVYDFGEIADGLPFIAMEYVDGETLGELLSREGRLSPDRAVDLVAQVTRALEAAHARGIAHRDLKPDNIMLTRAPDGSERAKVVDFGIAKAMEDEGGQNLTMPGWVVGTPEYVSPEQLAGQDLDGRSDLYSLGIVLFRMLTGGLPFHGDTWQEVMTNRLSEPPDRLADVGGTPYPSALEDVVRRTLEREPEERFPDAAAFREALVRAGEAAGPGPIASKEGAPDAGARSVPRTSAVQGAADGGAEAASSPWSRVDRTQALAGGGLLLVAAVAVVAWLLAGSGGEDASQTLARQLDRMEDDPSEATLRAVDDTARLYWNMDGLESEDRGLAAHVLGASLVAAGDTAAGLTWLERATSLAPAEDRFRNVLEEVRTGDVTELLERQVARLDGSPGESGIRSAEDSARLAWDDPGAGAADRALAALVVARARASLGDTASAIRWLERGEELDPGSERIAARLAQLVPAEDDPPPGPSGDELTAADAGPVLMRQFERLEGDPGPGGLRAVRDTAALFVDMAEVADRDRAFAAHVMGVAWLGLRDTARAIPHLERAVELDPDNAGYRTQLDVVTGGGP